MCGITGIVALGESCQVDRRELELMNLVQNHRGPDQAGVFHQDSIALGHTRLSIIDLSEQGRQPMYSSDKRAVIVFNGEIYNHKEIRNQLIDKGYTFLNHTDTEVIINAWIEWGCDSVKKLRGMFSFALYDFKNKGSVLLLVTALE